MVGWGWRKKKRTMNKPTQFNENVIGELRSLHETTETTGKENKDILTDIRQSLLEQTRLEKNKAKADDLAADEKKAKKKQIETSPKIDFEEVKSAFKAPTTAIIALAGLLTGLIAGFAAYVTKLLGINKLLKPLTKLVNAKFIPKLSKFFNTLLNFAKGVGAFFMKSKIIKTIVTVTKQLGGVINQLTGLGAGVGKFASFMKGFGKIFKTFFRLGSKLATPLIILTSIIDGIKGFLKGFNENEADSMFKRIVNGVKDAFIGIVNGLVFNLLDMVKGMVAWVLDKFGLHDIAELLRSFSFADLFEKFIDWSVQEFEKVIGFWTNTITEFFESAIGQLIKKFIDWNVQEFKKVIGFWTDAFSRFFSWLSSIIPDLFEKALAPFRKGKNLIGGGFKWLDDQAGKLLDKKEKSPTDYSAMSVEERRAQAAQTHGVNLNESASRLSQYKMQPVPVSNVSMNNVAPVAVADSSMTTIISTDFTDPYKSNGSFNNHSW